MDQHQYFKRRVVRIAVEDYLACYARRRFRTDASTGGIIIPDSLDLYHCVWSVMARRPLGAVDNPQANLTIWLPFRRSAEGQPCKHPAWWNYISPRNARTVEQALRRLFNWEFHHYVEERTLEGLTRTEAVRHFVRLYQLPDTAEATLLKNLQRYERAVNVFLGIKSKKKRKSSKS